MYPREVRWASQDSLSDACNMTDGNRARNDSLHTIVNPLESYCETDVDTFAPRLNVAVSSRHPRQPPSWTCACGNGAWSHPSSSCAWPNAGTGGTTSSCHPSWRTPFCARNVSSAPWLYRLTGLTDAGQLRLRSRPHGEADQIANYQIASNSTAYN